MRIKKECPICNDGFKTACEAESMPSDKERFFCDYCGIFDVTNSLLHTAAFNALDGATASIISYLIASRGEESDEIPVLNASWFEDRVPTISFPTVLEQANNLIRYIGKRVLSNRSHIRKLQIGAFPACGFPNPNQGEKILVELKQKKLITVLINKGGIQSGSEVITWNTISEVDLTLDGWRQYEELDKKRDHSSFVFLALSFNNKDLDKIKPRISEAIFEKLGLKLFDMREMARSGVIDNVMREQISASRAVLSDLSDDNFGAYWEAGYAEGLGKPVIYLCEKSKWEAKKTHFDTAHMTTELWGSDIPVEKFLENLVATLHRSIDNFAS